ncbi:unnamed protein product [Lactuca virosa]|uniref:Uncharacterized protein n=1 Tax=Lactuca virosa TaxID=75947 RepID=A0AAU9N916_9ASTR|nr:unnamed protein product [Lactuca virosa]
MRCLGSRYKMSNGCGHSLSSQTLPANMAIQLSKKRKIIANHIDALIDEGSESFSCYPHRHIQTFGPSSTICNNLFDGIPFNLVFPEQQTLVPIDVSREGDAGVEVHCLRHNLRWLQLVLGDVEELL